MTGIVWKIEVKQGDQIKKGEVCVVLESMKMEVVVESSYSGTIESIECSERQTVSEGQPLLTITPL